MHSVWVRPFPQAFSISDDHVVLVNLHLPAGVAAQT